MILSVAKGGMYNGHALERGMYMPADHGMDADTISRLVSLGLMMWMDDADARKAYDDYLGRVQAAKESSKQREIDDARRIADKLKSSMDQAESVFVQASKEFEIANAKAEKLERELEAILAGGKANDPVLVAPKPVKVAEAEDQELTPTGSDPLPTQDDDADDESVDPSEMSYLEVRNYAKSLGLTIGRITRDEILAMIAEHKA